MDKHEAVAMAVNALGALKGDDLERAKMSFGRMEPSQLDREYGESGQTPRQILAEYEARNKRVDEAIVIIKNA